MKAKYLLLILSIFCCMGIKAIEKDILLYSSKNEDTRVNDERSISIKPTASINGNTLCIYTNFPVEDLQIVVKDSYNNTVYSNNDAACSRSHNFELNELSKEEYAVELTIGDVKFHGYFSILVIN